MKFTLKHSTPALLILDLQELFSSPTGPFANTTAGEVIDNVNAFSARCAAIGMPILCSRYLLRDDLADAGLLAENPLVVEGHFCASAPSMRWDQRLELPAAAIQLQRNRPGAFWNGGLLEKTRELGVDTLLLCGLSVNNAISTTAREAFAHDLPALVVRECTGAAPFESKLDTYFEILDTWTAEVSDGETILARLAGEDNST